MPLHGPCAASSCGGSPLPTAPSLPSFHVCLHRLCVCQGPHATLLVLCPCPAHCSNAGTNAYRVGPLASQDPSDIIAICETNVIGTMLGALRSCCSHTAVLSSDP
jgi:hypothetical protein